MEKVHLILMLIDPEIILTTSVHISLPGSSHTASSDETRDGKYCPVIIQHYAKRSLILVLAGLQMCVSVLGRGRTLWVSYGKELYYKHVQNKGKDNTYSYIM